MPASFSRWFPASFDNHHSLHRAASHPANLQVITLAEPELLPLLLSCRVSDASLHHDAAAAPARPATPVELAPPP
ncbi:hypothetical protein NL676_009634 [Syzygium grande]|nr:hypothetical protein NL676_009634 [Syzygium grande]